MTEGVFGRLGVGVIVWGLGDWSGRVRRGPTVGSRMPGWGAGWHPVGRHLMPPPFAAGGA